MTRAMLMPFTSWATGLCEKSNQQPAIFIVLPFASKSACSHHRITGTNFLLFWSQQEQTLNYTELQNYLLFAATLEEFGCLSPFPAHLVVILVALLHQWTLGVGSWAIVFLCKTSKQNNFFGYVMGLVQWLPGHALVGTYLWCNTTKQVEIIKSLSWKFNLTNFEQFAHTKNF